MDENTHLHPHDRKEYRRLRAWDTIVWVDESGFYLLPGRVRTYAPHGQTSILQVPLTKDHLSVISGITPEGKLLILWDGSPIHRSQVVKQFLREAGAERIHLEQLPGYAPDLNADEGIWNYLKHVKPRNVCCRDLVHLKQELRRAMARLRHKRHIIQACIQQRGYL